MGWLVLVWNDRRLDATPFARNYENLVITYGTDYLEVRHQGADRSAKALFGSYSFQVRKFEMRQEFDYPALEGRLLSSSYAPQSGHPNYESMLAALQRIFEAHQVDGHVAFEYDTRVYFGRLD